MGGARNALPKNGWLHLGAKEFGEKAAVPNWMINQQQAKELGLAYVYMGYWIGASPKMQYKERFKPCESLQHGKWQSHLTLP